MKKLLISTLAATAVFASGAAFASDLVSEDSFFTKVANGSAADASVTSTFDLPKVVANGSAADASVTSTFDLPKVSEGDLFGDNQLGSH